MRVFHRFFLLALVGTTLTSAFGTEIPLVSAQGERVVQSFKDPSDPDRGWMLTPSTVQFNPSLSRMNWQIKLDRSVFRAVMAGTSGEGYRHRRMQAFPGRRGMLQLLLDSDGNTYLLKTADYGETWKASLVSRAQSDSAARRSKRGREEEAVDLSSLNAEAEPPKTSDPHAKGMLGSPTFKAIFDLLLHLRPGISPWTFDNYHALLLVDFIPKPEVQLSFEVSPVPRYYEIELKPLQRLEIRAGRIWIPFDDMNPHNSFGGFMNTSLLRHPGGAAFLPDLWTDLGVAGKYTLLERKDLTVEAHAYIVNGFQAGGTDPRGEVATYPSFAGGTTTDNNTDKAMGTRVQVELLKWITLGASLYTGRYTPDSEDSRRILMFGFDSQLRIAPLQVRFGYVLMSVGLPAGASSESFNRGGIYAEGKIFVWNRWYTALKLGLQQADDRLTDVNDLNIVGARIGYQADWYELSLQHHKDLKDVKAKVNREFTAFRLVVML